MSHALMVSNNVMLNDLYSLNLKVYVDASVTIKETTKDAINFINVRPHIDLIVCLSTMEGDECAGVLAHTLEENEITVPMIVIGEKKIKYSGEVHYLPPFLNLKKFVKAAAGTLGITAEMMADKKVPDYYPISIRLFKTFNKSPCDIFHLISKKSAEKEYSKIIETNSNIKGKVFKYLDLGVEFLFVKSSDRLKVVNNISVDIIERLDEDLTVDEQTAVAEVGFEAIANQLTDSPKLNKEMVNISNRCIETVDSVVNQVPKLKSLLMMLRENKAGMIYQHNILGTYISSHILKNIGWGSDEQIDKLRFTFFFHDIFLIPIYNKYPNVNREEELFFKEELTAKEKELVLNHARLAGEMVKNFPNYPLGSDAIITQHHGTTSGVGVAIEFKDDISPLAKVMVVAEEFVGEMFKQNKDGAKKYDIDVILEHLYEKFPRNTYKRIIKTLESIEL